MPPGPDKSFDPRTALERAMQVFWKRGYAAAGLAELLEAMGIGRKSLYDTFGSKRDLYLAALRHYSDTVIARICDGLADARSSPRANLERVLGKLQRHHSTPGSQGCLLGVAMAQADGDDPELAAVLREHLGRLEDAFRTTLVAAQGAGEVPREVDARDQARALVALTQGLALFGRVTFPPAVARGAVRATLQALS